MAMACYIQLVKSSHAHFAGTLPDSFSDKHCAHGTPKFFFFFFFFFSMPTKYHERGAMEGPKAFSLQASDVLAMSPLYVFPGYE
jgi:hypothetical protein